MKTLVLLLLLAQAASAQKSPQKASGKANKPSKVKVYTFGALDVEGKLKTPQLLYFLGRVKVELETTAPARRSFIPELERTAEDGNL